MFGLGGELSKEVAFVFILLYHFEQAHFLMFSGLLGTLSIKLLYNTAYFFSKYGPILQPKFLWFCLTCRFGKFKICPIILMLDWFHAWLSE